MNIRNFKNFSYPLKRCLGSISYKSGIKISGLNLHILTILRNSIARITFSVAPQNLIFTNIVTRSYSQFNIEASQIEHYSIKFLDESLKFSAEKNLFLANLIIGSRNSFIHKVNGSFKYCT